MPVTKKHKLMYRRTIYGGITTCKVCSRIGTDHVRFITSKLTLIGTPIYLCSTCCRMHENVIYDLLMNHYGNAELQDKSWFDRLTALPIVTYSNEASRTFSGIEQRYSRLETEIDALTLEATI